MYFVPSSDAQGILASGNQIADYLTKAISQKLYGKDTGFYVKAAVPTSYVAVVEAFGTKKADFAALTTFAYILARDYKNYDVEAVLSIERYGNERTYKGQIITHKDSGIKSIEDLKNKKFAYVDPASTSGFILPAQLFKQKGISLGETVFALKHDNVVTMVYNRQVDGGATFFQSPNITVVDGKKIEEINDARARVKAQYPDVEDKVKIVSFTEEIPTEPWVLRKNLHADPELNEKLRTAIIDSLVEFSQTEEGKKVIKALSMGQAIFRINDAHYDSVRKIIKDSELDVAKLMTK